MVVSGQAERAAMFDQMWRRESDDAFYTRTFHGADWDAVREMYEKFLPHVGTTTSSPSF
jgi:tricorn protease